MATKLFIASYEGMQTNKKVISKCNGYGSSKLEALTDLFWEMMDKYPTFKVAVDEDEENGYEKYFGENSTLPTEQELQDLIIDHADYYGNIKITEE